MQYVEKCARSDTTAAAAALLAGAPLAGERCPGVQAPEHLAGQGVPKSGTATVVLARGVDAANPFFCKGVAPQAGTATGQVLMDVAPEVMESLLLLLRRLRVSLQEKRLETGL